MARIIRTLALTGAAAAALLGTASAVHADTPEQASVSVETAVDRAAGASVTMPSGKTLHVRGLDAASYRADASHQSAVVTLADGPSPQGGIEGIDSSLRQAETGTVGVTPAQMQTKASGGTISVTVAIGIGLAIFTFLMVKKGRINAWHAVALVMFGVFLAPTTFGPLLQNLGVSVGTSLGNVWGGL